LQTACMSQQARQGLLHLLQPEALRCCSSVHTAAWLSELQLAATQPAATQPAATQPAARPSPSFSQLAPTDSHSTAAVPPGPPQVSAAILAGAAATPEARLACQGAEQQHCWLPWSYRAPAGLSLSMVQPPLSDHTAFFDRPAARATTALAAAAAKQRARSCSNASAMMALLQGPGRAELTRRAVPHNACAEHANACLPAMWVTLGPSSAAAVNQCCV
jgi:hypothetical protein